jgi:hypothetical protein
MEKAPNKLIFRKMKMNRFSTGVMAKRSHWRKFRAQVHVRLSSRWVSLSKELSPFTTLLLKEVPFLLLVRLSILLDSKILVCITYHKLNINYCLQELSPTVTFCLRRLLPACQNYQNRKFMSFLPTNSNFQFNLL